MIWGTGQGSLFYIWIFNYCSTICWNHFPIELPWHNCQKKSIDHLFFWTFYSVPLITICLSLWQYHTTLMTVVLYSKSWNQLVRILFVLHFQTLGCPRWYTLWSNPSILSISNKNLIFQIYHSRKWGLCLCCLKNVLYWNHLPHGRLTVIYTYRVECHIK